MFPILDELFENIKNLKNLLIENDIKIEEDL